METESIQNTNNNRRRIHSDYYEQQGRDYRITSRREMTEDTISEELRQIHLLLAEAQSRIRSLQTDYSTRLLQLEKKELRLEQYENELNKAYRDAGLNENRSSQ